MDPESDSSAASVQTGMGEQYSLDEVIKGLADDLAKLRTGEISVPEAIARAQLARQYFNGLRIVVSASKFLLASAKQLPKSDDAP
jgi:hypothetical protein